MSQTDHRAIDATEEVNDTGMLPTTQPSLHQLHARVDEHHYPPQLAENQTQKGQSDFGDSSGPLFSMYAKMAEEEDSKMVERWNADADGILIFVSPPLSFHTIKRINLKIVDWFVLCNRCFLGGGVSPGSQAEFAGYLCILS
jgi:hypothetical protein